MEYAPVQKNLVTGSLPSSDSGKKIKALHISLCSYPFVTSWGYQENWLLDAHIKLGHEAVVISSAYVPPIYQEHLIKDETFERNVSVTKKGLKIIRLPYRFPFLPFWVNHRLRCYKGLYETLEREKPDVIFVHELQFLSVFDVVKYGKRHPECVLKADTHAFEGNSAKSFASKLLLHWGLYRWIVRASYRAFQTMYYISLNCKLFMEKYYGISERDISMELLPLGGIILPEEEQAQIRRSIRARHGLGDDDILVIHSGKLEASKRSHEILQAFSSVKGERLRLFVIGSIPSSQKTLLEQDIQSDNRIQFLGWKTAEELREYLCAADIYAQLGSASASLQAAMCVGCPCILNYNEQDAGKGYASIFDKTAAWPAVTQEDVAEGIRTLSESADLRRAYAEKSMEIARTTFDYEAQAERILHDNRTESQKNRT